MDRDLLKSTVNFGFLACHENYTIFKTKREYNNVITKQGKENVHM